MSSKSNLQIAAARLNSRRRTNANRRPGFWYRVWRIITWPFRMIWRGIRRAWKWLCEINLIGLINLTLLIAIIILFSMLIIDIMHYRRMAYAAPTPRAESVPVIADTAKPDDKIASDTTSAQKVTLPIKTDKRSGKFLNGNFRLVKPTDDTVAVRQIPQNPNEPRIVYGDIIVDSHAVADQIKNGMRVRGNLYIQNMRKYTLPCDIKIDGNLFLRDVNMMQFCGDFDISGNIYVSPRSSFGPIPSTSHLGGYVIL